MVRFIPMLLLVSFTLNAQQFTRITEGPQSNDGGDSRSVNWVDYDGDGDLDLFFTNGPASKANNFLYRNDGNGTFTKMTGFSVVNDPGSYDGSTWADYDNDGHIDVFSATWYGQKNSLHRQRNGMFEKVFPGEIAHDQTFSETAAWGDYDNDGYVDLYLANSAGSLKNILYRNNGDGTFRKITDGSIVADASPSRSVDWCDFDNDGFLDLFIANEQNVSSKLFWNNGDGTFTEETSGSIVQDGGNSFGSSVADIDNDGDFDILVVNHANQNEFLYLNNGDRTFSNVTSDPVVASAGHSVGSAFGDLDNDGDLDLIVTNAFAGNSAVTNFLFLNDGKGNFVRIDTGSFSSDLGWSYGTALGDYDRDGDLDIAVANCFGANQHNALFRNEGNANAWLTISVIGTVSNASAIGTKVRIRSVINGTPVWQTRHVSGQSGYCGQNLEVHFGLGDAAIIDSISVTFPSGQKKILTNVTPRQHLIIKEDIPAGFLRGALQPSLYDEMAPVTVTFTDISRFDQSFPPVSWNWDLNGDGFADGAAPTASFEYTLPDTYSVSLTVSNGVKTDTAKSFRSVVVRPSAAIIQFSTETHNFGIVDVNTPVKDTTMYLYNRGKLTDSLTVSLIYGSSGPGTIKPDSALVVSPRNIVLAPGDSQAITLTLYPRSVIRTNLNITYTPKLVITSAKNTGPKMFEKTFYVKLQGTLTDAPPPVLVPREHRLHQNYPNPFNPSTAIMFDIASETNVVVKLFDSVGREVRTLAKGTYMPGSYQIKMDTELLAGGVYFYTMTAGNSTFTKKMVLVK